MALQHPLLSSLTLQDRSMVIIVSCWQKCVLLSTGTAGRFGVHAALTLCPALRGLD